ncbi:cupin domain-containing protein [Agrilutibacter solisilvae]|uniref:Cupin domain-containing protein n=1 Tax=Agrilutibacter solisilvae TaxID=2763317 RepID=A0A974Y5N6_9GAMM|nr:cupin domain-containing protein [Lysobacter solisilvae]QSX78871.1 cupin domain-containing protein [Lysobacter solisilvae]
MKNLTPLALYLTALLPVALIAAPPEHAGHAMAPSAQHVMVKAAEVKWGAAPPALEPAAQAAVLAGDPGQADGLFVLRLKAPAGFVIARHWHPTDEHVTVMEGDLTLEMGDGANRHSATFGPGDYVLLPAHMHHRASTRGGMVVQVHGKGPFEINYVDPKDDPRKRAPAAP